MRVLAVDPGRSKFGWALIDGASLVGCGVESASSYERWLESQFEREIPDAIILGDGTTSSTYQSWTRNWLSQGARLVIRDEQNSTIEGRRLWLSNHSFPWWARCLPSFLKVAVFEPALDGWAAYAIALAWLRDEGLEEDEQRP